MGVISIVFGMLLSVLGVYFYIDTNREHPTALIPTWVGLVLIALGAVTLAMPHLRKHLMHAAATIGLLGFLGTVMSVPTAITMYSGGEVERPQAVVERAAMCLLCLVFLGLCIKSFIDARIARKKAAAPTA